MDGYLVQMVHLKESMGKFVYSRIYLVYLRNTVQGNNNYTLKQQYRSWNIIRLHYFKYRLKFYTQIVFE